MQHTITANTTKLRLPESVEFLEEFDIAEYDNSNYIEFGSLIDNMNNTVGESENEY